MNEDDVAGEERFLEIRASMTDPQGKLIPGGVTEEVVVRITDEVAVFTFRDRNTTRRFAKLAIALDREDGLEQRTLFDERTGQALTLYRGLKRDEIKDLIMAQFSRMNARVKRDMS